MCCEAWLNAWVTLTLYMHLRLPSTGEGGGGEGAVEATRRWCGDGGGGEGGGDDGGGDGGGGDGGGATEVVAMAVGTGEAVRAAVGMVAVGWVVAGIGVWRRGGRRRRRR